MLLKRLASLALIWAVSPLALAQGTPLRDPTDPKAAVPAIVYTSPMPRAPGAAPVPVGSWRDANELAGRIGGWRAYLREAQAPDPAREVQAPGPAGSAAAAPAATPTQPTAPPASAPAPHKH